jgi:hypothetical protein
MNENVAEKGDRNQTPAASDGRLRRLMAACGV